MAKKTNRRKSTKGRKRGSSETFQQDFLDSLFGGGESFPLALPMKPIIPTPPNNIFPPDFLASAAHFGGVPPILNFPTGNSAGSEGPLAAPGIQDAFDVGRPLFGRGRKNAFDFAGSGGGGGGEPPHGRTPPPPPGGGEDDDDDSKDSKERNKRLDKILRLLNLLTKGKARFFTDAIDALTGGNGLDSLPGAEALSKFAPAVAAFAMAVKAFGLIEKNREARGAVEQRAAALGFDAKKAFSADVQMKAFGGNFESIAKPMASWADAMTGVQMGDAGKFSNIMKQVAELSGMGYNVDLRKGSGKFGMASNEEFFTRMTDALSQALQKGDIGTQQKIQSIAGFDSSIADYLTSIKGSSGDSLLKHAFARENALPTLQRANKRQGRRSQSTFWEGVKDAFGAEFGAIGDAITGLNLFGDEPSASALFLQNSLPKKAKGGRETRPAIFAEAGPEWFIPEKNDENSRALLISAAQACGFDMFATGGSRRLSRSLGFKGPNNDWRAKRRGLLGGSRMTAESLGFRGPNHDWRVSNRTFSGDGARMSERLGFKGPSPVNHTNTVTMNISKVEVSANNAKEFAESMIKARQNPLSNVAKSIASSVDTKRIA